MPVLLEVILPVLLVEGQARAASAAVGSVLSAGPMPDCSSCWFRFSELCCVSK